jgi:hypothetical protein
MQGLPLSMMVLSLIGLSLATQNRLPEWRPGVPFTESGCPNKTVLVYSPFKPYFAFWNYNVQYCWTCAICLFEQADEARKLQFAATSFIMGFIPVVLKDIAWPERRSLIVTCQPSWYMEVYIRAMGLEPHHTNSSAATKHQLDKSTRMVQNAGNYSKRRVVIFAVLSTTLLLSSYGTIAAMEIYSKRSMLGCPYPVFILTWCILAVVPAVVHTGFHRHRVANESGSNDRSLDVNNIRASAQDEEGGSVTDTSRTTPSAASRHTSHNPTSFPITPGPEPSIWQRPSAIQGASEYWVVQLLWAIYYLAGSLVFTSIAAVTVIEVFVWVMLGFLVAGAGKLSVFFLTLAGEETEKPSVGLATHGS